MSIRNSKLIQNCSDKDLFDKLSTESMVFYLGVDPTAEGIHIGHLIPIQLMKNLIQEGHRGIILIGGFTASIGDPTGKSETRKMIDEKEAFDFSEGILSDIKNIFGNFVTYVNNKDWLSKITLKEFLELSRNISVNKKLAMDTFSKRVKNRAHLSMSEFIYPDLQLLDFDYLNKQYNCVVQIGGGDQWGNMCLGVHYLKKLGRKAYALSTPLLTSNNKKISKTDAKVPFLKNYRSMYHYLLKISDAFSREICELFDIEILQDPILTKKNIFRFIYSIYPIQESLEQVEFEESRIFYDGIQNISEDIFIQTKEKNIVEIVVQLIKITKSEVKRYIKQNAIYIDSEHYISSMTLPKKFKLSIGKKIHFFIEMI